MTRSNEPITQELIFQKLHNREQGILDQHISRKTAVLVPLIYTEDQRLAVIFEKRSSRLKTQPGEISFPGGHWEPGDQDEWSTAQRETSEELLIPMDSISHIGDLDILVSPARLIIYPFVGMIRHEGVINPNPDEVEELIVVDLNDLLNIQPIIYEVPVRVDPGEDYPYHLIPHGKDYPWREGKVAHIFYDIKGVIIWGLTAKILTHFLEVISENKEK